jgi:hypothetical protein
VERKILVAVADGRFLLLFLCGSEFDGVIKQDIWDTLRKLDIDHLSAMSLIREYERSNEIMTLLFIRFVRYPFYRVLPLIYAVLLADINDVLLKPT